MICFFFFFLNDLLLQKFIKGQESVASKLHFLFRFVGDLRAGMKCGEKFSRTLFPQCKKPIPSLLSIMQEKTDLHI